MALGPAIVAGVAHTFSEPASAQTPESTPPAEPISKENSPWLRIAVTSIPVVVGIPLAITALVLAARWAVKN